MSRILHFRIETPTDSIRISNAINGANIELKKITVVFADALNAITGFDINIPWLQFSHGGRNHHFNLSLPYQPANRYHSENYDLTFQQSELIPREFTCNVYNDSTGALVSASDFAHIDLFFSIY